MPMTTAVVSGNDYLGLGFVQRASGCTRLRCFIVGASILLVEVVCMHRVDMITPSRK